MKDGEAALAFLEPQAPFTEAPTPHLILLDIPLPYKSGWDVLAWVRANPFLTSIPVVMMASVFAPADEEQRDHLQPARCLMKPRSFEEFSGVGKVIEEGASLMESTPQWLYSALETLYGRVKNSKAHAASLLYRTYLVRKAAAETRHLNHAVRRCLRQQL